LGIVKRVKEQALRGIILKNVLSVFEEIKLRDEELSFFESVSKSISQSVSTLLYTAFPRPKKSNSEKTENNLPVTTLTVPNQESATIVRLANAMTERRIGFVQAFDLRRTCAIIARFLYEKPKQKIAILCPNVRDARIVSKYLGSFSPLCVTGEESNDERYSAWKSYRENPTGLLITTRAGIFFCDAPTTTVIVVRSGHQNHVEHRRNPRIDAREVVYLFSQKFTTQLFFFDVLPRVDDIYRFKEENILLFNSELKVKFVRPSVEKSVSEHVAIVSSTIEVISETIEQQGHVLIILNKKGYAWRLRCKDCGHVFVCSRCGHLVRVDEQTLTCIRCEIIDPLPLRCTQCRSSKIEFRGFGSGRIVEILKKIFTTSSIQHIDAQQISFDPDVIITLATRAFIENNFDPSQDNLFQCVVYLDADLPLFSPSFRSAEQASMYFYEWMGLARANHAKFVVQTEEQEFFEQYIHDPMKMFTEENARRLSFQQPPFEQWIQIKIREAEDRKRELQTNALKQQLENIQGVRVTSEFVIRVPFSRSEEVLKILGDLGDHFLIDINAFS
jgi:primosomal protein N'